MVRAFLLILSWGFGSAHACLPEGIQTRTAGGLLHVPDLACPAAARTWDRWCIDERCYDDHVTALTAALGGEPQRLAAATYRYRYEDGFGNRVTCIGDQQSTRCVSGGEN